MNQPPAQPKNAALVTRSNVPSGKSYLEYKEYLRRDFFHSCAYCTMSEAEASAVRFTIDHYEPQKARPDLINDYCNLMYACDQCNQRKGDRCPPQSARDAGLRFFRPDKETYSDHFQLSGLRVTGKTKTGEYTIEAIDLNRGSLKKIRDLRARLTKCDRLISDGVLALRSFHIDQLPQGIKGKASRTIGEALKLAGRMADEIDDLLREHARSELIDPDPEAGDRAKIRAAKLKEWEGIHPGSWRAPRRESEKKR